MVKRYLGGVMSATQVTANAVTSSGFFNTSNQAQLKQSGNWLSTPGAPTAVTAVEVGVGNVTVSFTNPVNNGGATITSYTVTSSPGNFTATGSSSPITFTGLPDDTTYTFTVTATNYLGTGLASTPSNSLRIGPDFIITPSVGGVSNWRFSINGGLSIQSAGEYTINWVSPTISKVVKMWGGGGRPNSAGSTSWGQGAGGGAAVGTVSFVSGSTYILRVGGAGATGTAPADAYGAGNGGGVRVTGTAGSGGGYTGIFLSSVTQGNAVLMAGGGGGGASSRADGLGGRRGYAGGGTTGETGSDLIAGSGTQSAGGAAGGSNGGTPGAALQGGNGAGGGAGGGGGYYGGGGGGFHGDGGYGGGGGSGYTNPSIVTSATLYIGSSTTAGNSSDADRPANAGAGNTAGNASFSGALIIKA